MKGLCSYILPETDSCIGKRQKNILFPPEELSEEDSTSITVLLYGSGSHVYRHQFSEYHIKYMHYSLSEIQNALDDMSTPAHSKTVLRWKRRFTALFLMVAFRVGKALGKGLQTCVKILQDFLDRHREKWLLMLLRLAFTSYFIQFVNFVSVSMKETAQCVYRQISDLDWPIPEGFCGLPEGG